MRNLRLRALADAPAQLGDFLAEELTFPAAYWQSIADDTQSADRRVSLVAEQEGGLVGMVGGELRPGDSAVHLVGLWVDPAARGHGVGRALVNALLAWAKKRGAVRVELWVVDDNPAAASLYRASGFVGTGVRQAVPHAPGATETLLVRSLGRP